VTVTVEPTTNSASEPQRTRGIWRWRRMAIGVLAIGAVVLAVVIVQVAVSTHQRYTSNPLVVTGYAPLSGSVYPPDSMPNPGYHWIGIPWVNGRISTRDPVTIDGVYVDPLLSAKAPLALVGGCPSNTLGFKCDNWPYVLQPGGLANVVLRLVTQGCNTMTGANLPGASYWMTKIPVIVTYGGVVHTQWVSLETIDGLRIVTQVAANCGLPSTAH
jgi:hypothetical protein